MNLLNLFVSDKIYFTKHTLFPSAFPMDGFATNNKCRCVTTTSSIIPPRFFQRIEILPQGAHCRRTEIV